MAFHLHRLGLVGRALREAGYNVHDAADLAAGRTKLTTAACTQSAERLGIAVQQLTRDLTEEEVRSWSFYRRAAADPNYVWASARAAWQAASCTAQQAADIMGLDASVVWRSVAAPTRRVLDFNRAVRLTTALNITEGPERFLPSQKIYTARRSR